MKDFNVQYGDSLHRSGREELQRIVRPVARRNDWPRTPPPGSSCRRLAIVDTETSGLDPNRHCIIEICVAIIAVDHAGRVVAVERIGTGLQDPGRPLSRAVREVTGLSDRELRDQAIDRGALTAVLKQAEGCIAYNAQFDRPMLENLLHDAPPISWGCAMADLDWRAAGFQPGAQNFLLMQAGYHNPSAHRARDDVLSLIQLLAHECQDGETVVAKVLAAMTAQAWRFEATEAPYHQRHDLADQGYRWSHAGKVWHKLVRPRVFRDEYCWFKSAFGRRPSVVEVPAEQRFRADYTWRPQMPKLGSIADLDPRGDPF